jgi:hypothetical protein
MIGAFRIAIYFGLPLMTVWGWTRWAVDSEKRSKAAVLSLVGFAFGTSSLLLAIGSVAYALAIRGFAYYDPVLLRIYSIGTLLSLSGLLFSLCGVWRRNPVRWYAPLCSVGMLLFWFSSAMTE